MDANRLSSVSKADTDEKIGEFWDTHDLTDFDDLNSPDVEFEVVCTVPVEARLLSEIQQKASERGVDVEALVDLWLRQKLTEQTVA
ncbi:MAG: CopG family antitoxin [Cyanobacteria bacterium J06597_16]